MAQKNKEDPAYVLMEPGEKIVALRKEICRQNGILGFAGNSASLIPGLGALKSVVSFASLPATVYASFRSQVRVRSVCVVSHLRYGQPRERGQLAHETRVCVVHRQKRLVHTLSDAPHRFESLTRRPRMQPHA
jgi:hypothetical protein